MNVPFWNELNSQQCNLAFDSVMSCIFFFNSDTSKWNSVDCFNVTSSNLLWSYFIFWRYLSPSLFSLRDKNNLELLERRILDWKNTKVAWGSRPWRAERRKCSSQIMFGSLNSISTLAKMLLMMMSVIIFGTKTYNNTSHWMMYDSVTPSTFLDKLTTSNQVINCNEVNLRVRERHRIIFAPLSLIIMKESNQFYIYTLEYIWEWRVRIFKYM